MDGIERACDNCGNIYKHNFKVEIHDSTYWFDSFECAINKVAPRCSHCGTVIMGHGLESDKSYFCCANCARASGEQGLKDHS